MEKLGTTDGFGTLHIAPSTVVSLENVIRERGEAIRSNHVFGEGASPKFRSVRSGIEAILEPKQRHAADQIGKHEMKRIVFGAEVACNGVDVLSGLDEPRYYFRRTRNPDSGTQRIIDYWLDRWLGSRINHLPALRAVEAFDPAEWLTETFAGLDLECLSQQEPQVV